MRQTQPECSADGLANARCKMQHLIPDFASFKQENRADIGRGQLARAIAAEDAPTKFTETEILEWEPALLRLPFEALSPAVRIHF